MRILIAIFILVMTSPMAMAANAFFAAPVSGTATTTAAQVIARNNQRNYLIIQNTGSNPIIATFGAAGVTTEGVQIAGGGSYEPLLAPSQSVFLKSTTGTSTYNVIQGN